MSGEYKWRASESKVEGDIFKAGSFGDKPNELGRFPANLIHDNSEEVRECFPNESERFFKSIIYQAKASKSERNKGCDELEDKKAMKWDGTDDDIGIGQFYPDGTPRPKTIYKNNHPTVKPIALMEYLIKMVTPKGGTVLDSFMGSGSTGVACQRLGMDFIGIELVPEYFEIANARLKVKEILEVIK